MIVIGSNSEVSQAFIERALKGKEKWETIYLLSSNPEKSERLARHLEVKYFQNCRVFPLDLRKKIDYNQLDEVQSDLIFCAAGFLGKNTEEGLYDDKNTRDVLDINFSNLVPLLNYFAHKMESKRSGTMIVLSSVAGERGRQSNFIYGSAKAGLTAYLSGLRNYLFDKQVRVLTIKPGFMATKMTEALPLNPALTATPKQAADGIYKAYKSKKDVAYIFPVWRWIMCIIRNIPEIIFKRLKL